MKMTRRMLIEKTVVTTVEVDEYEVSNIWIATSRSACAFCADSVALNDTYVSVQANSSAHLGCWMKRHGLTRLSIAGGI